MHYPVYRQERQIMVDFTKAVISKSSKPAKEPKIVKVTEFSVRQSESPPPQKSTETIPSHWTKTPPEWIIHSSRNEHVVQWWLQADRAYRYDKNTVPSCLHPMMRSLVMDDWNMPWPSPIEHATSQEVAEVKKWMHTIEGWDEAHPPLYFRDMSLLRPANH